MAFLSISIIAFYTITSLFNRVGWCVRNYKDKIVPYSIGGVLITILGVDLLFFSFFINDIWYFLLVFLIWGLGFIDDRYGSSYPKGLKGHFSLFIKKGEVTTGLIKAIGVVCIAFIYYITHFSNTPLYIVLLLILVPHSMNLLDTKPLRVWKVSVILLLTPFILLVNEIIPVLFLIVIFLLWGVFESRMIGMLGDNGAMLIGAWVVVLTIEHKVIFFQLLLLIFAVLVTWIAEKWSIQAWVEATPWIRSIDQLGRFD